MMLSEGYSAEDKASLKLGGDIEARQASLNHGTTIDSRCAEVDSPEVVKFGKTIGGRSSRHFQFKTIRDSTGTGLFWLLTRGNQSAPAEAGPLLAFLAGKKGQLKSISLLRRWVNGALSSAAGLCIRRYELGCLSVLNS
ncbi:hypothetical protein HOY80DRAFT_1008108 [Tuber brumale]|nr:hypothetical protein HOY80DRAFT_1008108 [Tuber brumale]